MERPKVSERAARIEADDLDDEGLSAALRAAFDKARFAHLLVEGAYSFELGCRFAALEA